MFVYFDKDLSFRLLGSYYNSRTYTFLNKQTDKSQNCFCSNYIAYYKHNTNNKYMTFKKIK